MNSPALARIIDRGIAFLIIVPVAAFGAVHPWSAAVLEIAAFTVGAAGYLAYPPDPERTKGLKGPVRFLLLFLAVVVLPLIPLPMALVSVLAPGTAAAYRSLLDAPESAWVPLSLNPHETLSELLKLLAYAAVFRTITVHATTQERVAAVLRTLMLTGTTLTAFAVLQMVTGNGKLYWFYPVPENAAPFGPFINRNHGAAFLAIVAAVSAALWLYEMVRVDRQLQAPARTLRGKAHALLSSDRLRSLSLGLVSAMVCTAGVFLSLSRGAMLASAGGAGFFLLAARSRRSLRHAGKFIVFMTVLLLFLVLAVGWTLIEGRLETVVQQRSARLDTWADAVPLMKESPWAGTGLGTFARRFPRHQTLHGDVLFEHAENEYLELFIETGAAGSLAAVAAVGLFGARIYRRWRARHNLYVIIAGAGCMTALVTSLLHAVVEFHLRVPAVAMVVTIVAALLYAIVVNVGRTEGAS